MIPLLFAQNLGFVHLVGEEIHLGGIRCPALPKSSHTTKKEPACQGHGYLAWQDLQVDTRPEVKQIHQSQLYLVSLVTIGITLENNNREPDSLVK